MPMMKDLETAIAARVGSADFELLDSTDVKIDHEAVAGATAELRRVLCNIKTPQRTTSLSFFVKRLTRFVAESRRWPQVDDETDPFYWKREAIAYTHRFLWPSEIGIRPCECYFAKIEENEAQLFLEDVAGQNGRTWLP